MYLQTAFGLTIETPFLLPAARLEDVSHTSPVDVVIRRHDATAGEPRGTPYGTLAVTDALDVTLAWDEIGEFRVCAGREIDIRPHPDGTEQELNLCLSGAVAAMLLYQRGLIVMHGSVAEIDGQAVGFLATKGGGKSTLGMMMHQLGYCLLSDDILALEMGEDAWALPGFVQIKLWPDTLTHLGHSLDAYERLRPRAMKRGVPIGGGWRGALPLRHIFVLQWGEEVAITPLDERKALLAIIPHWYLSRFGTPNIQALQAMQQQFTQCVAVTRTVSVSLLQRPREFAALTQVAEMIREHVAMSTTSEADVCGDEICGGETCGNISPRLSTDSGKAVMMPCHTARSSLGGGTR